MEYGKVKQMCVSACGLCNKEVVEWCAVGLPRSRKFINKTTGRHHRHHHHHEMVRVWARQTDSAQRISADGRKEKEPKSDEKVKGKKRETSKEAELEPEGVIFAGEMEKLDDISWKKFAEEFFEK